MKVEFQGTIDRETYLRASRLGLRQTGITRILYLILGFVLIGTVVVPLAQGGRIAPWPTVIWGSVLLLLEVLLRYGVRQAFKSNKALQSPITGSATEEGVQISSAIGQAQIPWDMFFKAVTSTTIVLLYQSQSVFHIFPREFFSSSDDWDTFVGWAKQKTSAKPKVWIGLVKKVVLWLAIFLVFVLLWQILAGPSG